MPSWAGKPIVRELAVAWGHLSVLWAFAIVQPLLEVLGDSPEFFVARGNTRADILALAFGLTLVPPTVLVAVELLVWPSRRLRWGTHLLFVGVLSAAIFLQALEDAGANGAAGLLIGLALAAGAAAALLYARSRGVRTFATVLIPAPAVFVAIFLLVSPVSELVLPQDEVSAVAGGGGNDAPVVMLLFDELSGGSLLDRSLRIDAERYPGFAELAGGSTWYRNATGVDFSTERAVPAVLTGTLPSGDSLPIASDHPRNLFTLLGWRYDLDVQEPATELCPESLCGERARKESGERLGSLLDDLSVVSLHMLAPAAMEDDLPAVDTTFEGFRGPGDRPATAGARDGVPASAFADRPAQVTRFLRRIDARGSRPALDFLHVAFPHWPWQYLPSGQQYPSDTTRIPGLDGSTWQRDPFPVEQGYQRYLLQLEYVDRLVQRLIARLRGEGLWDRALVVVAADHGVSFRPGQPRRVTKKANLADIASVPLFVKAPGQETGR
ncbi:MAG TPA: sulfatase-like hydrolase/transferase, partial [Thermoleophilaceae bacterium]|nr:sulfatase-like hydrolase/transferase [Thermoleophilaceae bacterium]